MLVLAVAAVAGFRIHKGYFPKSAAKQELYTRVEDHAKAFCYRKLPLPTNKRWGNIEPTIKWTHCSSDHYEVWVIVDSTITLTQAEALATELNRSIVGALKYQFKISELQLKDEECLVSVFVASKDFGNGEKYVYGGTLCSFGKGNGIPSWLNASEVRDLFSNSLPIEF